MASIIRATRAIASTSCTRTNVCPLDDGGGHGRRSSLQAFIHLGPKDPADEGFARRADDERLAQGMEMVQLVQQLQVMPSALAKANAGVDQQALAAIPPALAASRRPCRKLNTSSMSAS